MKLDEIWRKTEALYKRYDRLAEKRMELEDRELSPKILDLLPIKPTGQRTHVNSKSSLYSYKEVIKELDNEINRVNSELEKLSHEINIREKNQNNKKGRH